MTSNKIFLLGFSLLVLIIFYYLFNSNSVSLWGDELWTLHKLDFSYSDLFYPGTLGDPNYPTKIIFFKVLSDLTSGPSPEFLVYGNIISIFFILAGMHILRTYLSMSQIILFIMILFSSEHFIRNFLEIGAYGMIMGISVLFSACFVKSIIFEDNSNFGLTIISGMFLSIWHPFSGLFVCSVFFILFLNESRALKKTIYLIGFIVPILFLFTYSIKFADGNQTFHVDLSWRRLRNLIGFMIPASFLGVLIFINHKKIDLNLKRFLIALMPIIISALIILAFSIFRQPIFQATYFMSFFPLFCFSLVILSDQLNQGIKFLTLASCLISVLFLYGPRALLPQSNFQAIIQDSHNLGCINAPIFFNNTTHKKLNQNMQETYQFASNHYSPDFQRPIRDYDFVLTNIQKIMMNNPECNIFGISGQKKQDVFKEEIEAFFQRNKPNQSSILVKSKLVDNCYREGCGMTWFFERSID